MLSPWIDVLTAPFIGALFGFGIGFFERDWGTGTVAVGLAFGLTIAVVGWWSPAKPVAVTDTRWDSLSRADRRQIVRAVARGRAVSEVRAATAAVQVADELANSALTPRERLVRAGLVVLLVGFVVASPYRGAPAGWVVAGALTAAYFVGLAVLQQSRPVRERARRAAAANRALLAPLKGGPAGVGGVGA